MSSATLGGKSGPTKGSVSLSESAEQAPPAERISDRVFQNTAALIAGRGLGLGISAATSILLARYLGVLRLGEYGALYSYLTLYGWLATFGLDPILAREASRRRQDAGSIVLTGVGLSGAFALAATLIAFLLGPQFGYSGTLRWLVIFAAVDLLVLAPLRLPAIVFQVDLRQWLGVGIGLLRQILWAAAIVLCAVLKAGLVGVILARTACGICEVAIILAATHRFLPRPWRFVPGEAQVFTSHAIPIAFGTLAVGIYNRVDQVMLHKMINDTVLGHYVVAVNLSEIVGALPVALMASLFPVLARLENDEERFRRYVSLSYRYLIVAAFSICLVLTLLAQPLVRMFYGHAYGNSAPMLAVLIWAQAPSFFGVVLSNALIARNLQKILVLPAVLGAISNFLLNLVMIPQWGGLGAAWATTISYSLAGTFSFLLFPKARSLAWLGLPLFLRAGALSAALVLLLQKFDLPVLAQLLIGVPVYVLGLWQLRLLTPEDFGRAWDLTGRRLVALKARSG